MFFPFLFFFDDIAQEQRLGWCTEACNSEVVILVDSDLNRKEQEELIEWFKFREILGNRENPF